MEQHSRCSNCGRDLTDEELYCYFCEMEVEKMKKGGKSKHKNKN